MHLHHWHHAAPAPVTAYRVLSTAFGGPRPQCWRANHNPAARARRSIRAVPKLVFFFYILHTTSNIQQLAVPLTANIQQLGFGFNNGRPETPGCSCSCSASARKPRAATSPNRQPPTAPPPQPIASPTAKAEARLTSCELRDQRREEIRGAKTRMHYCRYWLV
jgi:hypothetical protein